MVRITPIGTCRIHTPLSRAVARYPIELDLRRNYGFVHTSDEALQQLRYLQGEKQFQPEALPLVFRPGDADKTSGEIWEPADLNIVEISSAKRVLCGEDAVQINYLYRYFGDFFGSAERSRQYWNLVRAGHRNDLRDFLNRQPSFQMLSPADRDLLTRLSTEQQTFKTVKQDMAEIVERLGSDRVLFITHVNAATPDGEVIPSRDRLIRWVRLAAHQLDAVVFDPTDTMAEWGQERALENGGLDLTHYTPGFSDRLYDVLHQKYVAPLAGSSAIAAELGEQSPEQARLAARLEVMIGGQEFIAGARELHAALERHSNSAALLHLRGVVRSRIGDFRGALADLADVRGAATSSPAVQVALLEALNGSGNFAEALKIADGLIHEEADSAIIHGIAAAAAENLGRTELGAAHAKQAYRMDRRDLSAALRALVLLHSLGNSAEIEEWRREILENISASSSGVFELCVWSVRQADEDLFAATLKLVARDDKWSAIDLMEEAVAASLPKAIAASLPVAVGLGQLAPGLADRRSEIIRESLARAQAFAEIGNVGAAYGIAHALALLPELQDRQINAARIAGEGRRLIRGLMAEARKAIAQSQLEGDAEAVVEMGESVGDLLFEDGKSASQVARALQTLGRAQIGLDLLRRVNPDSTDRILVRRSAGRMAQAVGDYATGLEMYGSLRDDDSPDAARFQPEIDRFFETAEPRSLKKLTLLARAGDFDEALRLARAITTYIGPHERIDREMARMHKMLRIRLKEIQEGELDLDEREPVLRRMAQMKPDDVSTLRRLALELMRQFRYAEAAEYWQSIATLEPDNESAVRNRVRCATLAQRRASASVQVIDIAG